MRLLNPRDLTFEEFPLSEKVDYAIFSHTWYSKPRKEVLYREIKNKFSGRVVVGRDGLVKPGMSDIPFELKKVVYCCMQAIRDKVQWVWIDTCCLNKDSTAEVSEAINAMFSWYRNAKHCYVYLSDVCLSTFRQSFRKSKWFKRGWTLQELVAPHNVYFYDHDWYELGSKMTLNRLISATTRIDAETLMCQRSLAESSIARRMSWASDRKTTKPEDIAYCLLGVFGVNMPLLYGEGGEKAFIRLQEEIMRRSEDHTIFAWTSQCEHRGNNQNCNRNQICEEQGQKPRGPLARSPSEFADSADFEPILVSNDMGPPYIMTNRGLRICLPLVPDENTFIARLNCREKEGLHVAIRLRELTFEPGKYYRIDSNGLLGVDGGPAEGQEIYLTQDHATNNNHFCLNTNLTDEGFHFALKPEGRWKEELNLLKLPVGTEHQTRVSLLIASEQSKSRDGLHSV
ncbi:predicted protein [Uncinocarpus reesii 1704]|uniref:Uncharacterized protein n=1 Tax=Uncinocarpus reesii (strain UAMH 1704) TaxID=336963 RepID=C4JZB3_UNCRE|nr:uncharacterized protein UREG_07514 [Uncinocarpus reesii 1704]EEP82649.1 predicted protein [Uncinocarpus reesii 1704]